MDPATLREISRWLDQYTAGTQTLDARVVAAVVSIFGRVTDWNDTTQTLAATSQAADVVSVAIGQSGGLASQWIAMAASTMAGSPVAVPGNVPATYPRLGVSVFDAYSRPIFAYRRALEQGATQDEAWRQARQLAASLAATDQTLARRRAATAAMSHAPRVVGYRRVVRPELAKTGSCGLCIAASDRRYRVRDLLPIHTGCNCAVVPIIGTADPGPVLNEQDLKTLYDDAGSTAGRDLRQTRYQLVQHPELGPVIDPVDTGDVPRAA